MDFLTCERGWLAEPEQYIEDNPMEIIDNLIKSEKEIKDLEQEGLL